MQRRENAEAVKAKQRSERAKAKADEQVAVKPVVKRKPRLRMDPKTGATILAPKAATKPKPAAKVTKPKAEPVERVLAADVEAFIKDLGISKTQLAQAAGVSTSLISEWVGKTGKRPGRLIAVSRWEDVQQQARALVAALPQPTDEEHDKAAAKEAAA